MIFRRPSLGWAKAKLPARAKPASAEIADRITAPPHVPRRITIRINRGLEALPPRESMVPCCARAASGHAVAAPPSSVMNWRRLMASMGSSPEPAVPAYSRLRMHRKLPQVLGAALNRSEIEVLGLPLDRPIQGAHARVGGRCTRLRVGLGAAPARQIFRLFASRQAQRPVHRGGKICFDRLPFDLAAEKIRPQKLAERGSLLGKTARSPQLASEATERILLQPCDRLRRVGQNPTPAARVEGINQALVIEHGPKGVEVQCAQVEHNSDENVTQSLFVQRE